MISYGRKTSLKRLHLGRFKIRKILKLVDSLKFNRSDDLSN
jgi:hypothetical protein